MIFERNCIRDAELEPRAQTLYDRGVTNSIKIAIAKGRMLEQSLELFGRMGIEFPGILETKRLQIPSSDCRFQALVIRSIDVPTYVAHGAADLGIVGQDVLWEAPDVEDDLYQLLDLAFGRCRLVEAAPRGVRADGTVLRVATKYPYVTERAFQAEGRSVEVIKLYGSVELAPQAGMADVVVDLVETGSTLKANDLEIVRELGVSTARLIANRVRYKTRYAAISGLVRGLEGVLG